MKRPQAVIARYKENVEWTDQLKSYFDVLIYEKFNSSAPLCLPNIPRFDRQLFRGSYHAKTPTGRESHTYLYHIIKHYPHFAPITLFSQASVEDHIHGFKDFLKAALDQRPALHFFHFGNIEMNDKSGANLHRGLPIQRVYERLFDAPCPQHFLFHLSACFFVSRENLLSRPLAFYEQMMQIVYEEPLSGYIFERLWEFVLNAPHLPCHAHYPKVNRSSWGLPL